jgi:peptidoglycan hydrolase-like protein with peptidoglycan-binding domain
MRQTAGIALFFVCLSIIFIEPVRDSLNNLVRRGEVNEERAMGTAIPYKQHIKNIQSTLVKSGFNPGGTDGSMGDQTRQAVRLFQESRGLKPTGWLDARTLEAIRKEEKLHKEFAQMEHNRQVYAQFAAPVTEPAQPQPPEELKVAEPMADLVAEEQPRVQPRGLEKVKEAEKPVYDIKQIQKALKKAGLYKGKVDGKIGKQTKKAIRVFQKKNTLKVDGVVGEKTWMALKKYL